MEQQEQQTQTQFLAATKIQKTWRGYHIRTKVTPKRIAEAQIALHLLQQEDATLVLQSFFRIVVARRLLIRLRQEKERKRKETKLIIPENAIELITLLQSQLRFHISFKHTTILYCQETSDEAHKISNWAKGFLRKLRWKKEIHKQRALQHYHDSATVIQALIRGVLTRNRLELEIPLMLISSRTENGATLLQSVGRGFLVRKKFVETAMRENDENIVSHQLLGSSSTISRLDLLQKQQHQDRAAAIGQSIARRWLERHTLENLRKQKQERQRQQLRFGCIILIQKNWRGYLCRSRYTTVLLAKHRASLHMHCVVESFLVRAYDMAKLYHSKRRCARAKLEINAATKIQSTWRMFNTRRIAKSIPSCVLRIQRACRSRKDRAALHVLLRERSASKIQKLFRDFVKRKYEKHRYSIRRKVIAKEQEQNYAAIIIQAFFRMVHCRCSYLSEAKERDGAVRLVQRRVRLWVARFATQQLRKERRANHLARLVQKRWFKHTVQIKENFEIKRLEGRLGAIFIRSFSQKETSARTILEEEWEAWAVPTYTQISSYHEKAKEAIGRLKLWEEKIRYTPEPMLKLYDAQRFARGYVARVRTERKLLLELNNSNNNNENENEQNNNNTAVALVESPFSSSSPPTTRALSATAATTTPRSAFLRRFHIHTNNITSNDSGDLSASSASCSFSTTPTSKIPKIGSFPEQRSLAMALHDSYQRSAEMEDDEDENEDENETTHQYLDYSSDASNNNDNQLTTPPVSKIRRSSNNSSSGNSIGQQQHQQEHQQRRRSASTAVGMITSLQTLRHVDLCYTHLTLPLLQDQFVTIRHSTRVISLRLSHCSLGDDAAVYVIETCAGLDNLHLIDLSANPITDVTATHIIGFLETKPEHLQEIDLTDTLISRTYLKLIESLCEEQRGKNWKSKTARHRRYSELSAPVPVESNYIDNL